jgi:MEKHLA domain
MSSALPWQQDSVIRHSQRLLNSYQHWTGNPLLPPHPDPIAQAQILFKVPFVIVSHGLEPDPIFNYGNAQALALWQLNWATFTQMPSRCSAPPIAQAERDQLLAEARAKGYISNYRGIRIASSGQRFAIANVILWDVLNETNHLCGQAATFDQWQFID